MRAAIFPGQFDRLAAEASAAVDEIAVAIDAADLDDAALDRLVDILSTVVTPKVSLAYHSATGRADLERVLEIGERGKSVGRRLRRLVLESMAQPP